MPFKVADHAEPLEGSESREQRNPSPEAQRPNRNQLESRHGLPPHNIPAPDLLAEFDEYGTELHKDARVWKVYVDEADKHDRGLVNERNDSTDVILIFAALFSAISTAFLIESTKLLQPDPAEQSVQSLLVISQTLSAIANGTRSPGSVPAPPSDPPEFTPSRVAVCVNVLWYLSLGLSLATSFIAILAKDWCHSFMSGRTGHPHSQMCRRQQKWNMIEKWKMSELLTILPSLIHLALLLFSVGLCIHLYDTYVAVSIPIFCVTGAAIGFYIWSSIVAISIDYFPYPTIISRVWPTDIAQRAARETSTFVSRFASHPVIRNTYQVALVLVFVGVWILEKSLRIPTALCLLLAVLEIPLNECDAYLAQSPPLLQLVAIPLTKSVRYFVWYPVDAAIGCIWLLMMYLKSIRDSVRTPLSDARWGLEWQVWDPKAAAQAGSDSNKQDDITSLALSWLITNCEVPQSVDIALQSIAGATSRTPRQPLLDCHATLEILRRIASSSLYKGSGARTDMTVSLYSRALERLGDTAGLASGTEQLGSEGELEGLIWDVHLKSEKRVAASIVSGGFNPTPANLDAFRIGNTAASNTLKLLGRSSLKTNVDIDSVLGSIVSRLESHVNESERLHEAALLSLVNATALLLPLASHSSTVSCLGTLSMRVIEPRLDASKPSHLLLVNLAITCAYASNQSTHLELPESLNSRFLLRDVVGRLLECDSAGLASGTGQLGSGSELEGLIWDVHIQSERRVAASIMSGTFNPTLANLDAHRIGNTAASNTLKLLGRGSPKANVDIDSVLGSIVSRLESHVNESERLHEAALLSLVNATALLLPLASHSSTVSCLGTLSMRVIEPRLDASKPSHLLLVNLAITCAYASNQSTHLELPGSLNSRSLLRDVVGRLLECYAEETTILTMRSMFELETLATHPQAFRLADFDLSVRGTMLNLAASGVNEIYNSFLAKYQGETKAINSRYDMMALAQVIQSPLSLVPVKSSYTLIPFIMLGPIQRIWWSARVSVRGDWEKLASDSWFPTFSRALTQLVEQSDLIFHLGIMVGKGNIDEKFVGLGQLWLLLTVYLDTSSHVADERERLGVQLRRYDQSRPESAHDRHARIGDELVLQWVLGDVSIRSLGGWPARLMECVYQSRNTPLPELVYDRLQEHNVPPGLRGLSSFTSWRPQSVQTKTENRPPSMNGSNAAVHNENASGNDLLVPDIGSATIGNQTDDAGVGGRASPGDGQGAICEESVSEKLPHGTQDRGKVIESGGDLTALEGQGIGDTENGTGDLTVETGDVGNGTEGNSHVTIDMHASDKVSE